MELHDAQVDFEEAERQLTLYSLVRRAELNGESLSIRVRGPQTVMTFGRGRGRSRVSVTGTHENFYRTVALLAARLIAADL